MRFLCMFEYKLMLYITYANRRMEGGFVANDSWICGEWKLALSMARAHHPSAFYPASNIYWPTNHGLTHPHPSTNASHTPTN